MTRFSFSNIKKEPLHILVVEITKEWRTILMATQIALIQTVQIVFLLIVIPVLVITIIRGIIKLKVHREVYGNNIYRYISDKVLEKQTDLNKKQDGQ